MKLSNFMRYDSSYSGKGLTSGSHLEEEVWNTYVNDRDRLKQVTEAILAGADELRAENKVVYDDGEDEEAEEGGILRALHKQRERSPKLVAKKKSQVLKKTGKLECEVCKFDFHAQYGEIGEGFAECHHGKPISTMLAGETTKVTDLHIVCSNCHRMLHRKRPWRTVEQLREVCRKS